MAARIRRILLVSACACAGVWCRGTSSVVPPPSDPDAQSKIQTGDLGGALAIAERGLKDTAGRDAAGHWRFLLTKAEAVLWQGLAADALKLLASDPPPNADADIVVRRATIQAIASNNLQDFDRAEAYLKIAQNLAARSTPEEATDVALADGLIALARADYDRAMRAFELALVRARDARQPFREVRARGELGLVEMHRHRYATAADWFQSALVAAQAIQSRTGVAKTLGNLGWSYVSMGELDRALELYQQAHDESQKLGVRKDVGIWLTNIGAIHASRREFASAESEYGEALGIARSLEDKSQTAIVLTELASVTILEGDLARAVEYNDESLRLSRAIGDRGQELSALLNGGVIAVRQQRPQDARRLFDEVIAQPGLESAEPNLSLRANGEAGLARMYAAAGDVANADARFRDALRTMGLARAALHRDEFRLSTVTLARSIYDDYINFLMSRNKNAEACAVAETARAQTLKEGLGRSRAIDRESGAAGCPLPRTGVELAYWLTRERGYLWILTPAGMTSVALPAEAEVAARVERHTHALMGPRASPDAPNDAGAELYGMLVSPAEPWIARDSHVTVIPDGVLCGLNFETLIAPRPSPHYWIEDVTLTQSGSLTLSAAARPRAPAGTGPATLLLVGNPVMVSDAYPALTHAVEEIDGVKGHFAGDERTVLVGASATPAAYTNAHPGRFSFIHFVAHGVASRASPLDSVIVLADNGRPAYLYARDIIGTPLTATLVTISSCESAGARTYSGEGLVGLSWAFLRAGAHQVAGALWQVDDASTAKLMESIYDRIGAGETPADAMRDAKLALLKSDSVYRKPFYWAAFVLYTGA